MILTGKCLQDFKNQIIPLLNSKNEGRKISEDNRAVQWVLGSPSIILNSHIIEWFDSVGVYISIHFVEVFNEMKCKKGFESYVTFENHTTKFRCVETRQEATNAAIIKANDIYNGI